MASHAGRMLDEDQRVAHAIRMLVKFQRGYTARWREVARGLVEFGGGPPN